MSLPRISIQALDAFERVAQSGSVQIAAGEMGLSISSVSHHIARLEEQMGVTLFDRSSRPFTLTHAGQKALGHLSQGLFHLRRATSETQISGLIGTRSLRIGIVEDFESNVTPELAVVLSQQMPRATLSIRNILSHEAPALLRKGEIDVAVASMGDGMGADIMGETLLRDPFVMALPDGLDVDPNALMGGQGKLSFLRFNRNHLIGKQIDEHLARSRINLVERFAFDSAQSIMAVVASGAAWSIITPLGFMRSERFAPRVRLYPLPSAAFARQINLMSRADFDEPTRRAIAGVLRQIIDRTAVVPIKGIYPWLSDSYTVLNSAN
ncbi:transcriptional regulator [Amylibacter ulvae]|uniref:Transcriptional regulator n=1 Tax=Paramylibacter ulvae TaxID=1651968 RepID=A0ABQ3D207_9RHOB|nr:LysR family transcriptional regulator [Amylibacter ulvae]GHA51367.1 transcriptional regulator [Amylibacter ulvae]